jgi:nicotinamidase-related amidase
MHSKKALLIIDVQNDFTADNAKMPVDKKQAAQMIANLNCLIEDATAKNLLVVYIGNEYKKLDPLNLFRNFAALEKTNGAKQDERLHVVNENYFAKRKGNSFSNPALHSFLQKQKVEELLIAGLYAEHCVFNTIKDALKHNYKPTVLTDCVATKTDLKLEATIDKYVKLGVKTLKASSV